MVYVRSSRISGRCPCVCSEVIIFNINVFKVKLDGSKSYDPDGEIAEYIWLIGDWKVEAKEITIDILIQNQPYIELMVIDNVMTGSFQEIVTPVRQLS